MKKIKVFTSLLLTVASVLLLAACMGGEGGNGGAGGTSGGESYTLTVWGAAADQALLKEMCQAYAKANPQNEYKFLYGVQEEGNVAEKLLADVKKGADIYTFPSDQISRLYAGGALARVGGEIEKNIKEINTPDSVDAATVTVKGEDSLVAYPMTGDNCCFIYYDKRVHSPEDLESLDSMLAKAAQKDKQIHFKLNNDGWYLSTFFFSDPDLKYEVSYTDTMAEKSVSINYNAEGGLDIMRAIQKYVQNDAFLVTTDDAILTNAFVEGTASAAVTGTWNANAIKEALGDNMGVYKLPTAEIGGKQVQLSGFKGYKLIGVNAMSENRGEAHKLAQWLTNEQNQIARYEKRHFNPTNINALKNEKITSDPIMQAVAEQFKYNRTQKGVPANYWTPMGSLIQPIINARAEGKTLSDSELQRALDNLCAGIKK